ncbi:hypothetical protein FB45DRAFT_1035288 [Roridomyces roridus]|uniref:Uncharacterized protein n=1 Tax=Roridomyces roridus TaxID=1738132 RepID=A0AAD7FCR4_9AGAR|nr:hypothetical protein FB45DRAFT_1035288 [Roridomyces roridus]
MLRLLPRVLAAKALDPQTVRWMRPRFFHDYQGVPMNYFSYRTESAKLPSGWSCDWESWRFNLMPLYQEDIEEFWELTALVEPMAFDVFSAHFVFHAAGEYYFHFPNEADPGYTMTRRFTGKFASHDDFLERFKGELNQGRWVEVEMPPSARKWLRLDDDDNADR